MPSLILHAEQLSCCGQSCPHKELFSLSVLSLSSRQRVRSLRVNCGFNTRLSTGPLCVPSEESEASVESHTCQNEPEFTPLYSCQSSSLLLHSSSSSTPPLILLYPQPPRPSHCFPLHPYCLHSSLCLSSHLSSSLFPPTSCVLTIALHPLPFLPPQKLRARTLWHWTTACATTPASPTPSLAAQSSSSWWWRCWPWYCTTRGSGASCCPEAWEEARITTTTTSRCCSPVWSFWTGATSTPEVLVFPPARPPQGASTAQLLKPCSCCLGPFIPLDSPWTHLHLTHKRFWMSGGIKEDAKSLMKVYTPLTVSIKLFTWSHN